MNKIAKLIAWIALVINVALLSIGVFRMELYHFALLISSIVVSCLLLIFWLVATINKGDIIRYNLFSLIFAAAEITLLFVFIRGYTDNMISLSLGDSITGAAYFINENLIYVIVIQSSLLLYGLLNNKRISPLK